MHFGLRLADVSCQNIVQQNTWLAAEGEKYALLEDTKDGFRW